MTRRHVLCSGLLLAAGTATWMLCGCHGAIVAGIPDAQLDGGTSPTHDATGDTDSDAQLDGGTSPTHDATGDTDSDSPPGDAASASGIQFFPSDYVYNVPIDTLPVHAMSDTWIANSYPNSGLYVMGGFSLNIVHEGQATQHVTMDFGEDLEYPIPDDPEIYYGGGGDSGMAILDVDNHWLYEFYQPVQNYDGSWSATCGFGFDLSSYALEPTGRVTTSDSGTPQYPLYIRAEELQAGVINHASNFFLYKSQSPLSAYIWPARIGASDGGSNLPPHGARFRLKASFDISGYTPDQQTVLKAWKKYGCILTDQGGLTDTWWVSADDGVDFGYTAFASVHGSDFEVVDESSLMINEDSGQARSP
jgi:hypothetical protein